MVLIYIPGTYIYYIPIIDTPFELYVFWPSDTESIKLMLSNLYHYPSK